MVINQKGIDPGSLDLLAKEGIMALRWVLGMCGCWVVAGAVAGRRWRGSAELAAAALWALESSSWAHVLTAWPNRTFLLASCCVYCPAVVQPQAVEAA